MVRKKVEESYAKAIDQQQGLSLEVTFLLLSNKLILILALILFIQHIFRYKQKKIMIFKKRLY